MEKFFTISLSRRLKRRGSSFVNEERLKSIDLIIVMSLKCFSDNCVSFFSHHRKNDEKVRKIQEAQRKKREEEKEKHKEKSMEGMRRKKALSTYATNEEGGSDDKEDDDAEYYRSEVGQEPEKGYIILMLFLRNWVDRLNCIRLLQISSRLELEVLSRLCLVQRRSGLKSKRRNMLKKMPNNRKEARWALRRTEKMETKNFGAAVLSLVRRTTNRLEISKDQEANQGLKELQKFKVKVVNHKSLASKSDTIL